MWVKPGEQGADGPWGYANTREVLRRTVGLAIHARASLRRGISGLERVWDERRVAGAAACPAEHGCVAQHALRNAAADFGLFNLYLLSIEGDLWASEGICRLGDEKGRTRVRPEDWWEKVDRGSDGSDDDVAALYYVGSIGDDAEFLRPDIYAEIARR